ncbi:MAG TPA: hypothetical protein VKF14_05400 [Candidatus Dormibacteraeota bacterium]|nr:hypothetical protein [Candidatus Dormibacteraeota bacterium]
MIDRHALTEAGKQADALASQKAAYAKLGLDAVFEAAVIRRRQQVRR